MLIELRDEFAITGCDLNPSKSYVFGDNLYNCHWIPICNQSNNRRNNHFITWNNKTQTITEWEKELNLIPNSLRQRIVTLKWSIEKAMTTPFRRKLCIQASKV